MFASTKGEFAVQYSPDGKKVAFESHRGGNLEIWVCESDGQGCAQLTTMGSSASGVPTWSPDGKQVAFYSNAQGNPQIFVIPSEGGATRRLTSLTAGAAFPRWSRDGKWIYFSSKESGTAQVWKAPSGRRASCPGNSWRRPDCVRIARWKVALLFRRRRRLQPAKNAGRRR